MGRSGSSPDLFYSRLAWRSRAIEAAPSPSCFTVIGSGRRVANGTSGLAVTTPDPSGYSKLSSWAMISWPCGLTRKARNFCASRLVLARGERAGAGDVDHVARVAGREEVLGRVDLLGAELVRRRYQ